MLYFKIGNGVAIAFFLLATYNAIRLFVEWVNCALDQKKEFQFPKYLKDTYKSYVKARKSHYTSKDDATQEFIWGINIAGGILGLPILTIIAWPVTALTFAIYAFMVYDKVYNIEEDEKDDKKELLNEDKA